MENSKIPYWLNGIAIGSLITSMKISVKKIGAFFIIFLLGLFLISCSDSLTKYYRYTLYIDYKHISFQGKNSSQTIYLEIDSTKGMEYFGKLILNNKDTFLIKGFEKGHHYVTTCTMPNNPNRGSLSILTAGKSGIIQDSITIYDRNAPNGIIETKTILYRNSRFCR